MNIEQIAFETFMGGPDDTEAGRAWWNAHAESLTRFAALVRAQALEEAARACEGVRKSSRPIDSMDDKLRKCAVVIRALA